MKRHILLSIFIAACVVRCYAVFTISERQSILVRDAVDYDKLGWNMAAYGKYTTENPSLGIPDTFRPPLYPLFLSIVYKLFGHNYAAVRLIQALLGSFSCIIIYLIGKIIFGNFVGMLSGVISAVYPPFISYMYYGGPNFILSETLFMFLFLLAILNLINFHRDKRIFSLVWSAIFMAGAALTKPIVLLMPFFVFIWLKLFLKNTYRNTVKASAIFLSLFLLTIFPWTVRNYIASGKFISITSSFGTPFWVGNNSAAKGGVLERVEAIPEYKASDFSGLTQIEKNKAYLRKGVEYLLSHPYRIPYLSIKKILVQWVIFDENKKYNLAYGIILSFAILGALYALRQNNNGAHLLLLVFIYMTLVAVLVGGDPRFRYPFEPYLIILGSAGAYGVKSSNIVKNRRWGWGIFFSVVFLNYLGFVFGDKIYTVIARIF